MSRGTTNLARPACCAAERKTASGSKALTAGSSSSVHARRKASEPQPAGSGALTICPCSPSQPRSTPSSANMPASKEEAYMRVASQMSSAHRRSPSAQMSAPPGGRKCRGQRAEGRVQRAEGPPWVRQLPWARDATSQEAHAHHLQPHRLAHPTGLHTPRACTPHGLAHPTDPRATAHGPRRAPVSHVRRGCPTQTRIGAEAGLDVERCPAYGLSHVASKRA